MERRRYREPEKSDQGLLDWGWGSERAGGEAAGFQIGHLLG